MNPNQNRTRPATLAENKLYLLHDDPAHDCRPAAWLLVEFVGYTPCPAVVIVRDHRDKTRRVLRDDLFVAVISAPAGGNQKAAPAAPRP